MTVAISCNLSEGVVLAVDSAVTVPSAEGGVMKTYENAEKLFQLGARPVGVATYGLGALGLRSIGSYVSEFETVDPDAVLERDSELREVVEALRNFLHGAYVRDVGPMLEEASGQPFEEIPEQELPVLGVVVGGSRRERFYPSCGRS